MTKHETIAVLGAGGTMGLPMAANLAKAGYDVRAWNRSRDKAAPLAADGVTILDTAAEAAEGAGVILTMLADADAVLSAIADATSSRSADTGTDAGRVWLQMSTIGEAGTERCVAFAREHSLELIDAPVSGTKKPAEDGTLVILASGPTEARSRLEPIFDVLGQRTVWVGEAGAGTRLKVVINGWLLTLVEGAAETLALAEGLGLDPQVVLDALSGGPLDSPFLQMKGAAMIKRSFEPQFALKHAAKDAGLAVASADAAGLDLPLLPTIEKRITAAVDEHGDKDLSATYLTSAPSGN